MPSSVPFSSTRLVTTFTKFTYKDRCGKANNSSDYTSRPQTDWDANINTQ